MKYSLFSALLLLLLGACTSHYKTLLPVEVDHVCLENIRPSGIPTSWFDASVDVAGRHISGLLLIKNMPDSSHRVVFTNEAGVTFLDFEYRGDGSFELKKIFSRLDKRVVINTLRKDFALLLGLYFKDDIRSWEHDDRIYYGAKEGNEMFYFVTDRKCREIQRFEIGSRRKRMVSIKIKEEGLQRPEEIVIQHHTFNMVINLRKLDTVHG